MKKINFIILILFITFFLGSCKDKDTLEWTNEECVKAYVTLKDRERILNNIDDYFSDLDYKKLYDAYSQNGKNLAVPTKILFKILIYAYMNDICQVEKLNLPAKEI